MGCGEEEIEERERQKAMRYALYKVSRQAMCHYDLAAAMGRRGYPESLIIQTLERLVELGYLDDLEWARGYVRRRRRHHDGPRKIAQHLASKGFSYDEAQQIVADTYEDQSIEQQLQQLLERKYRDADFDSYDGRAKVIAALARKGYDLDLIHKVLRDNQAC